MRYTNQIRKQLRRLGVDLIRFHPNSHPLARRRRLLDAYGVSVVLDVGANVGQYGEQLRSLGYAGRIVSFEPLTDAYKTLAARARHDARWTTYNYALGATNAAVEMNVSANSYSSSLLGMLPHHAIAAPAAAYVGRELIDVRRLDSVFDEVCAPKDRIFLKIDTQGYERHVLEGAGASLARITAVQLEMSLVPLYERELPADEMQAFLAARGFRLVGLEPGFADKKSGELLQVDGIFHRV